MIPKSANPQRIKQNAQIFDFEISAEDMEEVSCPAPNELTPRSWMTWTSTL